MSSVDTRVVEARFNNQQFQQGVAETTSSLDKLKAGLKLDGAAAGLQNVSAAASAFNPAPMEQGAGRIAGAFSAMEATVFGAFASIGAKFASTALDLAKGLTIGPIKGGLDDYHAKLNSVQTIMNATGADMGTVNGYFKELDTYADKTIYNLSDMTGAFAKFTNAGVGMDKSVPAIKGVANMVALAGQGSEAASIAMYNLSQSVAGGFLTTTDYKSLNLANVATKEWKDQMIAGAVSAGKLKKVGADAYHIVGTKAGASATSAALFNEELKEGWASTDVLLGVLGKYGDTTTDIGKKAQAAAQDVKSFPMMMDTLKASVGTGWTDTFEILLGNVDESKQLFTGLTNAIGGFLGGMADSRNNLLQGWKDLGGRTVLIESLRVAFQHLGEILRPIGDAFRSIFPKKTSQDLMQATYAFRIFASSLKASPEAIDNIKRTFAGLFAVLHIGWTVLKAVASFFGKLFGDVTKGDSGILKMTASIGDFLVGLDKAISSGEGLTNFFDTVRRLIMNVVQPLKDFGKMLGNAFAGVDLGPAGKQIAEVLNAILSFGSGGGGGGGAEKSISLLDRITNAFSFLGNMARNVADWITEVATIIASAFQGMDYEKVMTGLQTGLLGGITAGLFSITSGLKGFSIFGNAQSGIFKNLSDGLGQLSGTMKSMQNENNASALMKLAAAIAVLAIALILLASVDPASLAAASVAMAILFVELTKGMAMFNAALGMKGAAKMLVLVPALIGIALAILLLVIAVKILTNMDWEGLGKGLAGLGAMLGMLSGAVYVMGKNNKRMLSTGAGLLLLAIAINILVLAVMLIARMDWAELGQGLAGVAAILASLALFTRFAKAGANAVAQGLAIGILAGAIYVLALAVGEMAKLSWEKMLQGLAGMDLALASIVMLMKGIGKDPKILFAAIAVGHIAGALGLIADVFIRMASLNWGEVVRGMMAFAVSFGMVILAIKAVERVNFAQLAGLSMVTDALEQMANAIKTMGEMSWEEIQRGLAGLVGAIGTLTIAMIALSKVPANAGVALGIVAASLALLAPALATMAAIPMAGIAGALVLLAGVFLVVGVATKLLGPSVPILIGFAMGMAMLGLAIALTGAGMLAFALGFTMLAAATAVGTAAIVAAISAIIGLIPMVMEQFGLGLIAFITVISNSTVAIVEAFVKIIGALIEAGIELLPDVGELILQLVETILKVLVEAVPKMIETGFTILMAFLQGISDHLPDIIDLASDIIVKFLEGIARNLPRIISKATDVIVAFINGISANLPKIIQAGVDLIINFVNGIAEAIRNNSEAMGKAGGNLATAIIEGMVKGIKGGIEAVANAAKDLAKGALNAAKGFLGIHSPSKEFEKIGKFTSEGFAIGLVGNQDKINSAVKDMTDNLNAAMQAALENQDKAKQKAAEFGGTLTEQLRNMAIAQEELRKAQNMDVSSKAKTAAARKDDTAQKTQQRAEAVARANEKIHDLQVQIDKTNESIFNQQLMELEAADEYNKSARALDTLNNELATQQVRLGELANARDENIKALDDETKALDDAIKTRDDYNKSLRDQYGTQETISKDTKLTDYLTNLRQQIVDTQQFTIAIQELRKRGLNDELYKQLLASGPSTMPFLQELLEGGQTAIDDLNNLGSTLDVAAGGLGDSASVALYQAGVDAAAGLVQGLKDQRANIEYEMKNIADYMVWRINTQLGIHSPSRVFAKVGQYSAEGLANGLRNSAPVVGAAAEALGNSAIDSMKKTIAGLGDLVAGDMDVNPVITPVLDLSAIQQDASTIGSLLESDPLSLDSSYSKARSASAGYEANLRALVDAAFAEPQAPIQFVQNNTSPKALSRAEIYRQTQNQLSVAKGALTGNAS